MTKIPLKTQSMKSSKSTDGFIERSWILCLIMYVIGLQVGDMGTFTVRDGNILSVQNGYGEIRQAGGFFVP